MLTTAKESKAQVLIRYEQRQGASGAVGGWGAFSFTSVAVGGR